MIPFVRSLDGNDGDSNESVPRTSPNIARTNHPTGVERRVHLREIGTGLQDIALGSDRSQRTSASDEDASIFGNISVVEECEERLMGVEDTTFSTLCGKVQGQTLSKGRA